MLRTFSLAAIVLFVAGCGFSAVAQDKKDDKAPATKAATQEKEKGPADEIQPPDAPAANTNPAEKNADAPSPEIPGLTRLGEKMDVWIDAKRKIVVVDGRVACREGALEMLACPKGTKEHESLLAINGKPSFIHAGLLAIGATPGTVVKFEPEYVPATGPTVEILLLWKDKDGKNQKSRAQEWIRHTKTKKAMEYDWVFSGSGFWIDEENGTKHYHGDAGDFICVSNFPTATLDLPIKSSQENNNLLFEAFTEHIPEKGTKVRMVLIPKIEDKRKEGEKKEGEEKKPAADKKEA